MQSNHSAQRAPRVTIGVPVYNGERFICATLDSLLAQTFTDFELIITDNASTDGTEAICREYVARDSRITYVRAARNLGPAANYNVAVDRARGEFFKWNAADDVCGPDFLKICVAALDANPDAIVAYPRTRAIDVNGNVTDDYDYELDLADPRPHVRLRRLVLVNHRLHGAHEMFGLMRLGGLIKAGKKRCHVRADSVLLVRLALLGQLIRLEQFEFFNRDHNNRSSRYLGKRQVRPNSVLSGFLGVGPLPSGEWWDASLKGKILFPEWRVMQEYYRAVAVIPLTAADRARCHRALALYVVLHTPKLARDLIIAAEQFLRSIFRRVANAKPSSLAPRTASIVAPSRASH